MVPPIGPLARDAAVRGREAAAAPSNGVRLAVATENRFYDCVHGIRLGAVAGYRLRLRAGNFTGPFTQEIASPHRRRGEWWSSSNWREAARDETRAQATQFVAVITRQLNVKAPAMYSLTELAAMRGAGTSLVTLFVGSGSNLEVSKAFIRKELATALGIKVRRCSVA